MKVAQRPIGRWWGPIGVVITAMLVILAVAGCAAPPEVQPVPPTPTLYAPPPTEPPPTPPRPTPAAMQFPLPAPSQAKEASKADDSGCIDCHTDSERLMALAVPREVEEKLSEGEG